MVSFRANSAGSLLRLYQAIVSRTAWESDVTCKGPKTLSNVEPSTTKGGCELVPNVGKIACVRDRQPGYSHREL
jgi:hypothetical protein